MTDTKHHTLGNLCPFWCQIPQKVFKLVSLSVGKKKKNKHTESVKNSSLKCLAMSFERRHGNDQVPYIEEAQDLAQVVQRLDTAIHWINNHSLDFFFHAC